MKERMKSKFREAKRCHRHRHRSHFLRQTGTPLPDPDRNAARRLALLAFIMLFIMAVNLVVVNYLYYGAGQLQEFPVGVVNLFVAGMAVISIVLIVLARSDRLNPQRKLDLGLAYEVLIAAIGGIGFQFALGGVWVPDNGISETCVIILIFPVVVPNAPWKILIASLIAASMDPLGTILTGGIGEGGHTWGALIEAYYWNYLCVFLALIPAKILFHMGRDMHRARDLGSYNLGEQLGEGGMGEVFRASHRMLARDAAVKLIRPESLGDPDSAKRAIGRFQREAKATAQLHSPHTIDLYDFGTTDDGAFYYVMELLDGFDLDTLVRRFGPQSPERTIHLLRQVCHSLWDAHRSALIHRDIKPANIYTCHYGHDYDYVKVLDFGLVKDSGGTKDGDTRLTMANTLTGTPAFMAPEMLLDKTDIDGRADLYALGCVGYWMLTGENVFDRDTPMKMLAAHLQEKPDPPSARTEITIPEKLDRIILSCLEKKPEDRPENAEVLDASLAACGTDNGWNADRARDWWKKNAPAGSLSNKGETGYERTTRTPKFD